MKKLLLVLVIALLMTNCSTDDVVSELLQPKLTSFNYSFMHLPGNVLANGDNLVMLEYDSDNLLLTRSGGFSNLDPSSGFNYFFNPDVLFSLTYLDKEIIIERDPASVNSPLNSKTTFLFENNKIVQKIIETPEPIMTFYEYDSFEKISMSTEGDFFDRKESFFYYNSEKNLDSIITKKYSNEIQRYKTVEIFSNFDNTQNPLKDLILFEDTFYRSLSENNYFKYKKLRYNHNGILVEQREVIWEIPYDDFGNINFGPE